MPPASPHHVRDLPAVAAATALVSVVPAVVVAVVLPPRSALAVAGSVVLAVVLSAVLARVGAAVWSRMPGARDMLFADLMAWTWVRRRITEHRLARARQEILDSHPEDAPASSALIRMGRLLEARDTYTYGHSRRVARHAQTIARGMRLPEEQVERIRQAALLHDIGKIYTPREIIDKPGRLTDEEFAVIRAHPVDGAALLTHLGEPAIVAIVRHHHERLDGRGYPTGLRGDDIPLGARIVAVADTFDALTSARPYRRPQTHKKALAILAAEAGTQLDADAVASFTRHYSAGRPAVLAAMLSAAGERVVSLLAGAGAGLAPGAAAAAVGATVALAHGGGAARIPEPVAARAQLASASVAAVARPAALRPLTARPTTTTTAAAAVTPRHLEEAVTVGATRRRTTAGDDGGGTTQAEGTEDAPATTTPDAVAADARTPATTAQDGGATHAEGEQDSQDPAPARTPARAPAGGGGNAAPTTTTSTTTTATTPSAPRPTPGSSGGGTTTTTTTPTPPPARTTPTPAPPARPTTPAPVSAGATVAVTTPAVRTPAVTTPAITTPAITTPVATVPAVTVPAVTVPSISVGSIPITITLGSHR